ncbi:hypothetical protein ES703_117474 [subsurface metagenome]
MERLPLTRVFDQLGDALAGEKITIEAENITNIRVNSRTSRHRGQFGVMRGNAYAVIDIPYRYVLEEKGDKSKRIRR